MADHSKIEWTEATWNPVVGCSIVSPGCTNCYAMKDAWRKNANPRLPRYHGLTKMTKGGAVWTGEVRTVPELLDWPLHRRKPLRIFVNSMSDLFHEDVPFEFIADVFAVMACTTRHIYQILTKRQQRMLDFFAWLEMDGFQFPMQVDPLRVWPQWTPARGGRGGYDNCGPAWPLENVWLGVSVEDQKRADERIPLLLQTPAAVRWISAEPLLGPVDISPWLAMRTEIGGIQDERERLDWVVVGGESGPGARPFDIAWARSLRDQCRAAGVPFFLKQIGTEPLGWCAANTPEIIGAEDASGKRAEGTDGDCDYYEASEMAQPCSGYGRRCAVLKDRKGGDPAEWPEDLRVREYPR